MAFQTEITAGFFKKKLVSIDEHLLICGDEQISCKDIVAFRYGTDEKSNAGGLTESTEYRFAFVDRSGKEMSFMLMNTLLHTGNKNHQDQLLAEEIWKSFGFRILNETIQAISQGLVFIVGEVAFSREGMTVPYRPFFGKNRNILVQWEDITSKLHYGLAIFRSKADKNAEAKLQLSAVNNAHVAFQLCAKVASEPGMIHLLSGNR